MNNNYIKNQVLSEENNKLIIYFINNVYNCEKNNLDLSNFKLYLLSHSLYNEIDIKNMLKNDNDSYILFFDLNQNYIDNKSILLIELIDVYDYEYKILSNYQINNNVSLNYPNDIKPYNIKVNYNNQDFFKKHPQLNYIIKSSPQLAYQANLKINNITKINNYKNFFGNQIKKYPKSYYSTSYNKFFKPKLEISPLK